jgi:hypothetical protein
VDLHRKRAHVVALDPTGEVVVSRRIGNAPTEFLRSFGELEPDLIEVVFEATDGWSWFADLLADAHITAHMAHPLARRSRPPGSRTTPAARHTGDPARIDGPRDHPLVRGHHTCQPIRSRPCLDAHPAFIDDTQRNPSRNQILSAPSAPAGALASGTRRGESQTQTAERCVSRRSHRPRRGPTARSCIPGAAANWK